MTTPRGIRNNNPLNIVKGNTWQGEVKNQTDPRFEQFVSMEFGVRAAIKLIRNYITGHTSAGRPLRTIDALIRRWAPPVENQTEAYIASVVKFSGIGRFDRLDANNRVQMISLIRAMARVECGVDIGDAVIKSAWALL